MAVITISRGSFSGGKMLARCLSEKLGYRCVDRDDIVARAAGYGVDEDAVRDALQSAPSFWDRFRHKRYVYLTLIQAALTEEVLPGNAVYHGNAGHFLLRGPAHVLRARIVAPIEYRLSMVMEQEGMPRDEALTYIQRMDNARRKWTEYLYDVDWGDPQHYDVVLNLEALDIREACAALAGIVALDGFLETGESRAAMADLALASKIRARLVIQETTSDLEVDVVAHDGFVTITGDGLSDAELSTIRRMLESMEGIKELHVGAYAPSVKFP